MNYFLWLFFCFWIPCALMWYRFKSILAQNIKTYLEMVLIMGTIAYLWDKFALRSGLWFFPAQSVVGLNLRGLPIEEYLYGLSLFMFIYCITLIVKEKQ